MSVLNIKSRKAHSKSAVSMGYFFMGVGIVSTIVLLNPIPFIVFGGIGAYLSFSYLGFEINNEKTEYREFGFYLGLKIGKWHPLNAMKYVTVFHVNQSETTYGGRSMNKITTSEKVFKVFLLSASHRQRVLVKQTTSESQAKETVELLEKELGLKYVKYNPQRIGKKHK